jgi:hypothetical protein
MPQNDTSQEEEIRRHGLLLFRQVLALKGQCFSLNPFEMKDQEHCSALAVSVEG